MNIGVVVLAGASGAADAAAPPKPAPSTAVVTQVPLGPVAGAAQSTLPEQLKNPYAGDPQAVQQGKKLFINMNCAGCHGYGAKGGIGPNLTDPYWRYGAVPAMVFNSMYEGRPKGMPAWHPALPAQDLWKLVAYIQSLGGTYPPDQYQAWLQGDKQGDIIPPEVAAAAKVQTQSGTLAGHTPEPKSGTAKAPTVAPNPDLNPPSGAK